MSEVKSWLKVTGLVATLREHGPIYEANREAQWR